MDGRTLEGKVRESGGGVGRNVADALGRLGPSPYLISAVGDDSFADFLLRSSISHLCQKGIRKLSGTATGSCVVLCDHSGECRLVVGDMEAHSRVTETHVKANGHVIARSSLLVLDGNLTQQTTEFVLRLCHEHSIPVWFEPTDIVHAYKPFLNENVPKPKFISPNLQEFIQIYKTIFKEEENFQGNPSLNDILEKGYKMAEIIDNIIITMGKEGVMVIRKGKSSDPFFTSEDKARYLAFGGKVAHRIYKPELMKSEDIVNVSGAGDCFAGGFIAAMLRGEGEASCVRFGFKCSAASLKSDATVPDSF